MQLKKQLKSFINFAGKEEIDEIMRNISKIENARFYSKKIVEMKDQLKGKKEESEKKESQKKEFYDQITSSCKIAKRDLVSGEDEVD